MHDCVEIWCGRVTQDITEAASRALGTGRTCPELGVATHLLILQLSYRLAVLRGLSWHSLRTDRLHFVEFTLYGFDLRLCQLDRSCEFVTPHPRPLR